MSTHEDELQRNLKQLQLSVSMDDVKKKSMRDEIKKHAVKKQRRFKIKRSAMWFSTAAALMIFSVILLNTFANDQSTLPVKDHDQTEYNGSTENKDPSDYGEDNNDHPAHNDNDEPEQLTIDEGDTETKTIMLEGMEEETEITNFVLKPYGIQFQMDADLNNYEVLEDEVIFATENDMATIEMSVREDAEVDDVASDIQSEYTDDFDYIEEPSETSQDENSYQGIEQLFSDPPQGYYVYQIGDDVFVIKYEYDVEAADGMGPILKAFRESINE